MNKKILSTGIILLFIGLALAPSINANITKESELVEITTEVCGLNSGKHTVQLTKDEAEKVDELFDSIRERLNATESREEAVGIFTDAVVELDKYGLLGGLSVKQAQKMVTGNWIPKTRIISKSTINCYKNISDLDNNSFCLIAGESTEEVPLTWFHGLPSRLMWLLAIKSYVIGEKLNLPSLQNLAYILIQLLGLFLGLKMFVIPLYPLNGIDPIFQHPFMLGGWINFGAQELNFFEYAPSEGWVSTYGKNGFKKWEGEFYGNILTDPFNIVFLLLFLMSFVGVSGFFGFLYKYDNWIYPRKFLGYAFKVSLGPDPPY